MEGLGHSIGVGRLALVEQEPQRLVHAAFSLLSGQEEDRQIILDHAAGPPVLQQVVSHPEPTGGEHRSAVAVFLERSRLAGQPVDGDAELGHAGEVALGEPTRLMNLREEHLLGRSFEDAPLFDPPLQGPELDVGETAREAALQVEEEGLGLEPRVEPEQLQEFGPDVLERVLPGAPGVRDSSLTGKQVGVAVLACRLLVDFGPIGGVGECGFGLEQLPQPPELTIGDHPFAPVS